MPAPSDLVHQTSTTTGTGAKALTDVNGKRSFLTAFGTGGTNTFDYYVSNRDAPEWERGTGHENAGTLVSDTVIASSNSNNAVNFSAGTKDVTNDVPAPRQVWLNAAFATDNRLVRTDGVLGAVQQSGITVSDTDTISGVLSLTISTGTATTGLTISGSGTDTQFLVANTTAGGKAWNFLSTGTGTGQPFGAGHFQVYNGSDGITGLGVSPTGSCITGLASGALATTATTGDLYIPTCAGLPTGVPSGYTGKAAIRVDSSNNKLYFYSGGSWRDAGP